MDVYDWHSTEPALHAYISAVATALAPADAAAAQYTCDASTTPAGAYIAVDGSLPGFPDRDVALIWDERHGWGVAIETHCGEDLLMVSYLGGNDPVPEPERVARFARRVLDGAMPGHLDPPEFATLPDLPRRLSAAAATADVPAPEATSAAHVL
ncbi:MULTISPECIES: DUF6292 family protein [Prauserella salsuginis group]|uniref:DUF6292 family protein n=1 Tax=Prauserella salsuginis TaxID=387889 RepID=A0ABW6G4P0_9PSEU|nr:MULTISPECIES: DUF6292 family protein [Prauserella salsuginis group]MCR3718101.1 hypothetical protein [Prauserella flava]MCR3732671.1 hypothetical protein [Prauserella salsuginis]